MWQIKLSKEARKALSVLDNVTQKQVLAGIKKVSKNPLPNPDGYGKPLGNKGGHNLTGFFKIKYRDIGIRVVYSLTSIGEIMNILVISKRDDNACYEEAVKLYEKYGDKVFNDTFDNL